MEIIIDYNSDKITIIQDGLEDIMFDRVKDIHNIKLILEEILNAIDWNPENTTVVLTKIDEDIKTTIGEW